MSESVLTSHQNRSIDKLVALLKSTKPLTIFQRTDIAGLIETLRAYTNAIPGLPIDEIEIVKEMKPKSESVKEYSNDPTQEMIRKGKQLLQHQYSMLNIQRDAAAREARMCLEHVLNDIWATHHISCATVFPLECNRLPLYAILEHLGKHYLHKILYSI